MGKTEGFLKGFLKKSIEKPLPRGRKLNPQRREAVFFVNQWKSESGALKTQKGFTKGRGSLSGAASYYGIFTPIVFYTRLGGARIPLSWAPRGS